MHAPDSTSQSSRKCAEATIAERNRIVRQASRLFRDRSYRFHKGIEFEFADGTLTVTGPVPSFYAKQLVQESLLVIDGVQRIDNRVDVVYPTHKRSALGSTLSRSRRSSDFCDPRTAV